MPVRRRHLFNFSLPAIAALIFAICWPIAHNDEAEKMATRLQDIKKILIIKKNTGIYILLTGIVSIFASLFCQVHGLCCYFDVWSSFAGFLYIYSTRP